MFRTTASTTTNRSFSLSTLRNIFRNGSPTLGCRSTTPLAPFGYWATILSFPRRGCRKTGLLSFVSFLWCPTTFSLAMSLFKAALCSPPPCCPVGSGTSVASPCHQLSTSINSKNSPGTRSGTTARVWLLRVPLVADLAFRGGLASWPQGLRSLPYRLSGSRISLFAQLSGPPCLSTNFNNSTKGFSGWLVDSPRLLSPVFPCPGGSSSRHGPNSNPIGILISPNGPLKTFWRFRFLRHSPPPSPRCCWLQISLLLSLLLLASSWFLVMWFVR